MHSITDFNGPEPSEQQVLSTRLPNEDLDPSWHDHLLMRIMRSEAGPEGIYRGSTKRLALATGLPFHDVHVLLMLMEFRGLIEAIGGGIVVSKIVGH